MSIITPKQIEYFSSRDGEWKKGMTKDVFTLAVVSNDSFLHKDGYCGINVCLVFDKEKTAKEYEDLCYNMSIVRFFPVYVFDTNGAKIPVTVGEGNGWTDLDGPYDFGYRGGHGEKVSTACLFGYINPFEWKHEREKP